MRFTSQEKKKIGDLNWQYSSASLGIIKMLPKVGKQLTVLGISKIKETATLTLNKVDSDSPGCVGNMPKITKRGLGQDSRQ